MKLLKFIKGNKAIVFAFVVVLLAFGLFALPGQFAHYGVNKLNSKVMSERFIYHLNGYQWAFATVKNTVGTKIGSPVAQGIAIIVMLGLSVFGLVFSKKSSFVSLLTSLVLITISILCFTISVAGLKAYPNFQPADTSDGAPYYSLIFWVPYVVGGLVLLAGAALGYRTFKVMKSEVGRPTQQKGPSYSYLHK